MGIQMDEDAWIEMTPENVAIYLAWRIRRKEFVVDGCSGVGSNSIQFARLSKSVLGIDSNAERIRMSINNAKIYRKNENIQFVHSDIYETLSNLSNFDTNSSCLHLSPPWGGKQCYQSESIGLDDFPIRITPLICLGLRRLGSVVVHLPRNSDLQNIVLELQRLGVYYFEIERIFYNAPVRRLKFYYLYIDRNLSHKHSLYSSVMDVARLPFPSFMGNGITCRLYREVFLKTTYLGTCIADLLSRPIIRKGVSFKPVSIEKMVQLCERHPTLWINFVHMLLVDNSPLI